MPDLFLKNTVQSSGVLRYVYVMMFVTKLNFNSFCDPSLIVLLVVAFSNPPPALESESSLDGII